MVSFLSELRRRNVLRVAAFYAAAGWLLVQVATQVFPFFDIPNWVVRVVVIAITLGFPASLVFAWFYELTPEGLKLESEVAPGESITHQTGRKLDRWIIAALALAVVLLVANSLVSHKPAVSTQTATVVSDKSVAVLPFENLSDDKSNAYFAEGIQDEILTRLAKIGALKVISRTSTRQYAAKPGNLQQIARELEVANIVEGSVQKIGDAVHINVQLIRADTDGHLWADSYNRKLDDVFAVEGEVAQTIAETLNARLTAAEQQALRVKPTNNAAAYTSYTLARAAETGFYNYAEARRALAAYHEATRQDPHFALAWAHAAMTGTVLLFNGITVPGNTPQDALHEADTALSLQPDLGEAWLAQGYYRYRVQHDYIGGLQAFEEARKRLPNDAQVITAMYLGERRVGRWDDALKHMHQSLELDPRNVSYLVGAAIDMLMQLRRFDEARQMLDRSLQIAPANPDTLDAYALIEQMDGRLDEAGRRLAQLPPNTDLAAAFIISPVQQAVYERRFADAIGLIDRYLAPPGKPLVLDPTIGLAVLRGQLLGWLGRRQQAQQAFTRVVQAIKPTPDTTVSINETMQEGCLALAYAGLGERQAALDALRAEQAAYQGDDFDTGVAQIHQAQVLAQLGDTDAAIAGLPKLLQRPANLTVGLLRLDPVWDPLRSDPRFQKLIVDHQSAATAEAKP